jgi:hypothetical protein
VPTFGSYPLGEIGNLRGRLKAATSQSPTLRDAGRACLDELYREFGESLALVRLFATVRFAYLPDRERHFARQLASGRRVVEELSDDTLVATLMASRGVEREWNDPHQSVSHLAIPILSASFIQTIPLVSRILADSGIGVPWLKKQSSLITVKTVGGMAELIYVEDARTTTTGDGYKVIPSQDFVEAYGIRTVLAMGGRYLNGTTLALLLFTTEHVAEEQAARFTTILNTVKASTMKVVMDGKLI